MSGGTGWKDPTPGWFDDVAVWLALRGRRDQIGRPLHRAERHEVARRVIAAGGDVEAVAQAAGCRHGDAKKLVEEVMTTAPKPRMHTLLDVLDSLHRRT